VPQSNHLNKNVFSICLNCVQSCVFAMLWFHNSLIVVVVVCELMSLLLWFSRYISSSTVSISLLLLPTMAMAVLFSAEFYFSVNMTAHELLLLAALHKRLPQQPLERYWISNSDVKVMRFFRVFFVCVIPHLRADATLTTSRSLLNFKVKGQGHMVFFVFSCPLDTHRQYLALSEGFTCGCCFGLWKRQHR